MGVLGVDQLDPDHQPEAAHAQLGMPLRQQRQALHRPGTEHRRVRRQLLGGHGVDAGERGGARDRVAAEGGAVVAGAHRRHHLLAGADRRQGEAAAESLGHRHDMGGHAVGARREPVSGAAEAGLDLVEDQQRPVGVGALAQAREEAPVRRDGSRRAPGPARSCSRRSPPGRAGGGGAGRARRARGRRPGRPSCRARPAAGTATPAPRLPRGPAGRRPWRSSPRAPRPCGRGSCRGSSPRRGGRWPCGPGGARPRWPRSPSWRRGSDRFPAARSRRAGRPDPARGRGRRPPRGGSPAPSAAAPRRSPPDGCARGCRSRSRPRGPCRCGRRRRRSRPRARGWRRAP